MPCEANTDCVLASTTCCECESFAVHRDDPLHLACGSVECEDREPGACGAPVIAKCNAEKYCELACEPQQCDLPDGNCERGFLIADNGCVTCACADVGIFSACIEDAQCVRTRADCCGCELGGFDTAVLAIDRDSYDAGLMCDKEEACPGVNTCNADEALCVQGNCVLAPPQLPEGACGGRPELAPCPEGQACVVNADSPLAAAAAQHKVGLCMPVPPPS